MCLNSRETRIEHRQGIVLVVLKALGGNFERWVIHGEIEVSVGTIGFQDW